jgi:hypothetical protein
MKSHGERLATLTVQLAKLAGLVGPLNYLIDYYLDYKTSPAEYVVHARAVRNVSNQKNLDCFPFLLNDREKCTTCNTYVFMLVQPDNTCVHCWGCTLGLRFQFHK